jgi:hypothetical protein
MRFWPGPMMALPVLTSLTPGCDRHDGGHATGRAAPLQSAAEFAPAAPPAPSSNSDASEGAASIHCESDPRFPTLLDVPEASAAAEVEIRKGVRELLVVADSDRRGAALAYALPDGPARKLTLPLDLGVTDDVEGIAWRAGHLYALASTGYVERFTPDKGELTRDEDAYPLGPPPFTSSHPTYAWGQPPDFEGLCLRPPSRQTSPARCAGYAASRAYGWLVCLVFEGDRLRVSPTHPRLPLSVNKEALSDCAFGTAGGPAGEDLLVTTNVRGGSTVYKVDEETGALAEIKIESTLNNEAIAIDHDGRLYQFMDSNAERSPALRAMCTGW